MPRISIITRAKDEEGGVLLETMRSVQRQTLQDFEVILVYGTLKPETLEQLNKMGFIRLFDDAAIKPYSSPRTLNYGISKALGEIIVILNADATPASEDWLENLLRGLAYEGVIATYGRQIPRPNADIFERRGLLATYPPVSRLQKTEIKFSNVNSAFPRQVWEDRPFKEDSFWSEDLEFAKWAIDNGHYLWYDAEAAVYHSHNWSLSQHYKVKYVHGQAHRHILNERWSLGEFLVRYLGGLVKEELWLLFHLEFAAIFRAPVLRFYQKLGFYRGTNA